MKFERVRKVCWMTSPKIPHSLRLAVAPDLHSAPYEDVLDELSQCDGILIPGDLVDRHRKDNHLAERFVQEVPAICPVFLSLGNHEVKYRDRDTFIAMAQECGVHLLDNCSELFHGIRLGGLSSVPAEQEPDTAFLEELSQQPEFRILLCHHPEVARDWVQGRNIDLTLCGHAHGGQIQIGNRGLYAPGQGFFATWTHGFHDDGRILISRGMTNAAKPRIPRFHNPCELIILELRPGGGDTDEAGRSETIAGLV